MSHREVAMNRNWKHGDAMCSNCRTAGAPTALAQGRCPTCGKPSCIGCRDGGAESAYMDPHHRCVRSGELGAQKAAVLEPWDPPALVDLYRSILDRIDLETTMGPEWQVYLGRLEQAERYRSTAQLSRVAEDFDRWLATRSAPRSSMAKAPNTVERGSGLFDLPAEGLAAASGLATTRSEEGIGLGHPPIQPGANTREIEHAAGRGVGRDEGEPDRVGHGPVGPSFGDSWGLDGTPDNAVVAKELLG